MMTESNSRRGRLLTPDQASEITGLSVKTLAQYRWAGGGAPYRKYGRSIRYDENELDDWMRRRRFTSTSQEAVG